MKTIKGGIGPNLFRLADGGSLAPAPISGPQFFTWTGEVRPAKKGEWFISGAIPEAYYCVHDHDDASMDHIAISTATPQKIIKVDGLTYQLVL